MTHKHKNQLLSDDAVRKLAPKLRMFCNGNAVVNSRRAAHAATLAMDERALEEVAASARPPGDEALPKGTLDHIPKGFDTNVFVLLNDDGPCELPNHDELCVHRKGNVAFARCSLDHLDELARCPHVAYVEIPDVVKRPIRTLAGPAASGEQPPVRCVRLDDVDHGDGEGVLIGIVDVDGFDFTHPELLGENGTRFEAIWDQGASPGVRPAPQHRPYFGYGAEFRKEHLDRAIAASEMLGVPAWEIERQSQVVPSSHGTHVASIAAGSKYGVCKRARLAGVLISLPQDDQERRKSFADSSRIAHAVEYLMLLADELGCKAVSINVSLGTNGHAHDGSSAISRWIDSELARPGRAVTVAAGNAGQQEPTHDGDIGFTMGRIHTSGRIPSSDLSRDIHIRVV